MLEIEKKRYPVYRKSEQAGIARRVCTANMAIAMSSDRRDSDTDGLCTYLKKTYRGVCDACDIKEGDIVLVNDERIRVISVAHDGAEMVLHLESVQIIDTGYYELGEITDV